MADEAQKPKQVTEVDSQTRARAAKALHEKNANERKKVLDQERSDIQAIADTPGYKAIMAKFEGLRAMHLQLAEDGVGYRQTGERNEFGEPVGENIFFTPEKRMTELDKGAGIKEAIDFMKRMTGELKAPVPVQTDAPKDPTAPDTGATGTVDEGTAQ
jgi:hypothetical protein